MDAVLFQSRRKAVFAQMQDNSVAILGASTPKHRSHDTEYPYRQNSYFYYLTGFNESDAIALLIKRQGKTQFILFCKAKNPSEEQWTGVICGPQDAKKMYAADDAFAITEASKLIPELIANNHTVYYLVNENRKLERKIFDWVKRVQHKIRQGVQAPYQFHDLSQILNEQRLFKSAEEIKKIQRVCDISVDAHIRAMQACKVGMNEYELEAVLLHEFYRQGSRYPAYTSIVASGDNACILHYIDNQRRIQENELILIDAGAELDFYCADITRTFPANGKFNAEQSAIYDLVLNAQLAAIEKATKASTWEQLQATILEVMVEGLVKLKILKGNVSDLIEKKAYLPFYMHSSGHWLGMDVHDVGEYREQGQWRKLKSGMVLTVEPGIYISRNNQDVDAKWRGIGVRIEDDILVTDGKAQVLTERAPKTIRDIEHLMSNKA